MFCTEGVIMRIIAQVISVILIAVGVGLLVAGGSLTPATQMNLVDQAISSAHRSSRDVEFVHHLAIAFKGFGACFLTLGVLGLLVPWANVLFFGRGPEAATINGSSSTETTVRPDTRSPNSPVQ